MASRQDKDEQRRLRYGLWTDYRINDKSGRKGQNQFIKNYKESVREFNEGGEASTRRNITKFIEQTSPVQRSIAKVLDISDRQISDFKANQYQSPELVAKMCLWKINADNDPGIVAAANSRLRKNNYDDRSARTIRNKGFFQQKYLNCLTEVVEGWRDDSDDDD